MSKEFFPSRPEANPTIYAYQDMSPQYDGMLKVGFTIIDAKTRVAQQYPIIRPGDLPYRIHLEESAIRNDGSSFADHDVHRWLKKRGFVNPRGEWFKCSVDDVRAAILAVKAGELNEENRTQNFEMRFEQKQAVRKTADHQ